mgnify:CR=1 FL=1
MADNPFGLDRVQQSANFLEWNFTIFKDRTPWPVEEGMTQLLAHESAEGFAPRTLEIGFGEDELEFEVPAGSRVPNSRSSPSRRSSSRPPTSRKTERGIRLSENIVAVRRPTDRRRQKCSNRTR